uniref:Intu_longin_1 domain-containing protein n=1 Tax=Panagrellus redivivus TaxID=6233 RepID=A0A7E4VVU2_PANRE
MSLTTVYFSLGNVCPLPTDPPTQNFTLFWFRFVATDSVNKQPKMADPDKAESFKLIDMMSYFFVSRPASGRREGFEYQRVMYFNPETEDSLKQTDITGVAEAFIGFTENFRKRSSGAIPDEYDHRYIKSKKQLEVYVQVEKGQFILGLGLNREACDKVSYFVHMASIKALVIRTYETFRLFYGTLESLFAISRGHCMQRLDQFFSHYLSLMRISQIPLIDLFSGVGFMTLHSIDFLEVQCFVTRIVEKFPTVCNSVFLYQDKLVHYTVDKSDISVLYRYLTQHLLRSAVNDELKPDGSMTVTGKKATEPAEKHLGRFITGVVESIGQELTPESQFPTIYMKKDDGELRRHSLVVYRSLNATLCLLVELPEATEDAPEDTATEPVDLSALQAFIDPELSRLGSTIGDHIPSTTVKVPTGGELRFHYVYFNPDSLSLKTSFSGSNGISTPMPPTALYRQVCETFDHFVDVGTPKFTQVEVKSIDDWWIVVKKENGRILTLFLPSIATTTVVDIHENVEQIIKSYFVNLFTASP